MSYHPGDHNSGVRWREDTGLELRCTTCPRGQAWWPLTEEFWSFRSSFKRCRACVRIDKNKRGREASRRMSAETRAQRHAYQAQYRKDAREAKVIYARDHYWADPEKHRAKARERYYRNREAILARKRDAYASRKAA